MDAFITWLQGNWFFLALLGSGAGLLLRVDRRVQKLFQTVDKQEKERLKGSERTELIFQAVDATLDGLHSQGCNGKVTAARAAFDSYLQRQAAR